MKLSDIELSNIPGLDTAAGLFGSVVPTGPYDDKVVNIMVLIYDNIPPGSGG